MTWRMPRKCVLLMHFDGPNGSTTFSDEANHAWTIGGGTPTIVTAQSVFGGCSGSFPGSSYIATGNYNEWTLHSADTDLWSVRFRVRFNGDPGTGVAGFIQQYQSNDEFWSIFLTNNQLSFQVRTGATNTILVQIAWNPSTAIWYDIEITKYGTTGYMFFVDGSQIGTTTTDTDIIPAFAGGLYIGRHIAGSGTTSYLNGWIDELAIFKGKVEHAANFTVPTKPYQPMSTLSKIASR